MSTRAARYKLVFQLSCLAVTILLVVIALIAEPSLWETRDYKIHSALFEVSKYSLAIEDQKTLGGRLPDKVTEFKLPRVEGLIAGSPWSARSERLDPWGRPYRYRRDASPKGFLLYSTGANGIDENGEGDDVINRPKHYLCADYGINCQWTLVEYLRAGILAVIALCICFVGSRVVVHLLQRLQNRSADKA